MAGCIPLFVYRFSRVHLWIFWIIHPQLAQDLDCIICPSGSYQAGCSNGCASSSGTWSGSSGSGSNSGSTSDLGCIPCHASCQECFGPLDTQCYECTDLFLLLQEPNGGGNGSICDNFLTIDTTRSVLQCVEECPQGSSSDAGSQQCKCQQGTYQNGTECFHCSSNCATCVNGTEDGCLACLLYSYEDICVQDCPLDTLPSDNQQCLPVYYVWVGDLLLQ